MTFILFMTHLLLLSIQKIFRYTRVHKFDEWSIILDKNWACKKWRRKIVKDHCECVWKWNLEIYDGEGSVKKIQEGWLPSKGIYARRERDDGWSNMILGHYKWESNGVAVHTTGKGIGRAKPQSGGNRGNSRVIFQRRIRHNRRRTICQNVNPSSLLI